MIRGMVIDLNDEQLHTLTQVRAFLDCLRVGKVGGAQRLAVSDRYFMRHQHIDETHHALVRHVGVPILPRVRRSMRGCRLDLCVCNWPICNYRGINRPRNPVRLAGLCVGRLGRIDGAG